MSVVLLCCCRWKNQLHGDLFLTRHLLILREQLIPFNMNLQSVEKQLDFSTTGSALTSFVQNSMSLLRFDSSNTFFQIARDGLPGPLPPPLPLSH
jgi:conserved oligomeric Golgi complex subunit 3